MSLKREFSRLVSRRVYLIMMIVMPIAAALFFLDLLSAGLPENVPVAIVDQDNSSLSRKVTRSLGATESIKIVESYGDFDQALDALRKGVVYGIFYIPPDFEKEAVSQRAPTIAYYSNMSYYIPGTLSFKGFKTIAVSASGQLIYGKLVSMGVDAKQVDVMLQPVVMQDHPVNNPWINYSIYLSNSFIPGVMALMVLLVTVFSVCSEIKSKTSVEWMAAADGSMMIAVLGKLMPQTIVFFVTGVFCQSLLYGYCHFPLNCNSLIIIGSMLMLIIATQSFALMVCCIIPNLRLALSVVSLVGVLSFSVTGFSFPVESMYGSVGIFSYVIPLRYYFLIYVDQALNGVDLYYSRWYFIALTLFPIVAVLVARRLKTRVCNPIYVP